MSDLSITALYIIELHQIHPLSDDECIALEERARQGDQQARNMLIEDATRYVAKVASSYAATYLQSSDYLELVGVGNLALVEHLDQALEQGKNPSAFLRRLARREMWNYCMYHSRLIRLPEHTRYLEAAPRRITSLEWEVADASTNDPLTEIVNRLEPDEQPAFNALLGPLHEALETLTDKQREVIDRHYGLDGYGPETIGEINRRLTDNPNNNLASKRHAYALQRLREILKRA